MRYEEEGVYELFIAVSGGGDSGASASITMTPETKYHIAQITDNGVVQSTRTSPYIIAGVQTAPSLLKRKIYMLHFTVSV